MDRPPDLEPPVPESSTPPRAARWRLPRLPLLIGVVGLGAFVSSGVWVNRRAQAHHRVEAQAIQQELAAAEADAAQYRERYKNLLWNAQKVRDAAAGAAVEPLKSWLRERAGYFDALVARIDRSAEEKAFESLAAEIKALCAQGDVSAARARLLRLPEVKFPAAPAFLRLQEQLYFKPLAELSRQNPTSYGAFQKLEPEAAKADIAALKQELAGLPDQQVTPQLVMKFELLGAALPKDDPVVADLGTLVTAAEYFVDPDPATLQAWRAAQKAVRAQDWESAVTKMQAITRTAVRTRQPFRAAYGRALLNNRPDDVGAAYPLLVEAARAGDAGARAWVAQQDLASGRTAQAMRWLEASVTDGETAGIPQLLALYAKGREEGPRDAGREAGVLQRIVSRPDAPPLANLLLARLYESGEGGPPSPARAFEAYRAAAEKQFQPAWPEVARCYLRGDGTNEDLAKALEWASRAYAAGERDRSVPILAELINRSPERSVAGVQQLLENEQTAAPAGFSDRRVNGRSVSPLAGLLARYFDERGQFGQAAELYGQIGKGDRHAANRHSELTATHVCSTCGGNGKVQRPTLCATCAGKGTVVCAVCDGRGFSMAPGAPPCATCGGTGGTQQDGRNVLCGTCGGTGKGKGSVVKKSCPACIQGRVDCRECIDGRIVVTKECPECHGAGKRSLADQ